MSESERDGLGYNIISILILIPIVRLYFVHGSMVGARIVQPR